MDGWHGRSLIVLPKIIFTERQCQTLSNHAENEKPNESCAILFGSQKDESVTVEEIFLTKNIEQSPVNFTISPEERLRADKMEQELGKKIIAIFHSHPNSEAFPSSTDKKFMDLNPVVWVIFSGSSKEFRGFVLNDIIREIPVEIK